MRMTKLLKAAAVAAGIAFGATAGYGAADGDIYEIRPCTAEGAERTAWATKDSPLPAGSDAYFLIRLQKRDATKSVWYIDYDGVGSKEIYEALYPMQIGVYISGKLEYATLTDIKQCAANSNYTDLIFKYHVEVGDFALPAIVAVDSSGSPAPANNTDSAGAYYLNPNRYGSDNWVIRNSDGDDCNFWIGPSRPGLGVKPSSSPMWDYDLSQCGIYVQTVGFDSDWETPATETEAGIWRTVHQDSKIAVGPVRLEATSAISDTVTMHVWSDNEAAVKIAGGRPVHMQVGYEDDGITPRYQDFQVADVTITGGQVYGNFSIFGVAENGEANLVLSAWDHYRFPDGLARADDYLTVPVKCIEPMPVSIVVERDDATVIAPTAVDEAYLTAVTRLTVYATQAPTNDVHVTIQPSFQADAGKTNWGDYLRFSTSNDSVETLPPANAPTVVLEKGRTEKKYIYVYALRAEKSFTIGTGRQVQFTPVVSQAEMDAAGIKSLGDPTGIYIDANAPLITSPTSETILPPAAAGQDYEFDIAVNDTYADMRDTLTGYTVSVSFNGTEQSQGTTFIPDGEGYTLVGKDDDTVKPTIKIPATLKGGDYTVSIKVTSPIRKLASAVTSFKLTVTPAKSSKVETLDEETDYIEGSIAKYRVTMSDAPGQTVYAFLVNYDDAPDGTFGGSGAKAIIRESDLGTKVTTSKGIRINADGTRADGSFTLQDGVSEVDGGSTYQFGVVFCTTQVYDPEKRVAGYPTTDDITITVYNKEPVFDNSANEPAYVNGIAVADGTQLENEYPKGQVLKIAPNIDDVDFDLKHGFKYKYTISRNGKQVKVGTIGHADTAEWEPGADETIPDGTDINKSFIQYNFPVAGLYTIKIQLQDKDLRAEGENKYASDFLTFSISIIDQPQVQIVVDDTYLESTPRDKIYVGLGGVFPDSGETVYVRLTVDPPPGDNPGVFELSSEFKAIPMKPDGVTPYEDLAENQYYVPFTSAAMQDVGIEAKDGTLLSYSKGFTIRGEVVNETESIEAGVMWKDYYRPFTVKAYVQNETPVFAGVTPENTNEWTVAGGAATAYPIRFMIQSDVDADFAGIASFPGIKVTIMGCDTGTIKPELAAHPDPMEFYVKTGEDQAYTFTPNFGTKQGSQTITLMIEDKDGGQQTWTYKYFVKPSKFLTTIPNGPSGSGNSEYSQKYVAMANKDGRGEGHVFVPDATFSDANMWRLNWNCSSSGDVEAYAWGYRVGAVDNGWLNGGNDSAISDTGAAAEKAASAATTAGYYQYPDDEKDSFFYAWLISSADDGGTSGWELTLAPEQPNQRALPATVKLPASQTEDGNYPRVHAEAVFSKEWQKEDNLGDINQDGIPDAFALMDWGSGSSLVLSTVEGAADNRDADLADLSAGNPDADFLPGFYNGTAGGAALADGMGNSYAPVGRAFSSRLELRGFGDGLNEVSAVTTGDPSFSEDETKAWEKFVEANNQALTDEGKDDTDPEWLDAASPDLSKWSPEPRGLNGSTHIDPTVEDTDADSFPDGWEYFFWYQAKVWAPIESDPLGKPRKGQDNIFERFNLANIIVGTKIEADEVLARFDPCVEYKPDDYQGAKHLKYDFDGDGLSDLEELLLGTNPCHWDTDGDRLCDAWEVMMCLNPLDGTKNDNPDNDFMAFRSVRKDVCWLERADAEAYADALTSPNYGKGLPEDVRVYGLPDLRLGVDYDIMVDTATLTFKYVTLRKLDLVCYSFNPKWIGGEQLTYGLRSDIPDAIPSDWVWGWYMVDMVKCETKTIAAGERVFPDLEFVLVHDQVHDGFGFDPRTAWHVTANGYVSDRWDPNSNPKNVHLGDKTGIAYNTRAYANYDEYLVMKYRLDYGIDYSPMTKTDDPINLEKESIWSYIQRKTTNPNKIVEASTESDAGTAAAETDEEGESEDGDSGAEAVADATGTQSVSQRLAALLAEAGKPPVTAHGADTDQDGVPDGWELYMYRCPNAAPAPDDEDGIGLAFALDFDQDELAYAVEYAGTDSCEAYKDCPTIYDMRPGAKSKWFNKFFPTNPGTMKLNTDMGTSILAGIGNADGADTDLDGIIDSAEGGVWTAVFANGGRMGELELGFVYGSPADNGTDVCIRGGGMNPCTIDTDLDGIPDGWEMQHAGVPVKLPEKEVVDPENGDASGVKLDAATFLADGIVDGAELPDAVYIAGGMDATWKGDALFDGNNDPDTCLSWDSLLGTNRDVDFDRDGLQNYQEYLTQSVRHFRYDDITTPLMGRQLEEGHYVRDNLETPHSQSFGDAATGHDDTATGYPVFDPSDPAEFAANAAEAWNGRSFVYYQTVTTGVKDVVKVVDPYTGATSTNRIYYTAQKKMFKEGAALVEQHVAEDADRTLQYSWTVDGWRSAGYFAPPRREWDRAIASREFVNPLYMWPITGTMVGLNSSVAGYATTDPRMADTDGDSMDDFYEMFHGLNPLLGTTPATADETEWRLGRKYGDIVAAQFYMAAYPNADTRGTFNAWFNEWIYPWYSGPAGRNGDWPMAGGAPIQAPQAYDPILYPWSVGTPMVDADGDGMRNDEERIVANVADPVARHTDPTPLWFTERTTPASFVAQYYATPSSLGSMPWGAGTSDSYERAALKDVTDATTDIYFGGYASYMFSFEENEGYDTDGDMTPDGVEVVSTVRKASDPLVFADPARNQALYLPGEESYAISRDMQARPVDSIDFLKQFTVECWVLPERSGVAQTIVDRAVAYEGDSINTDKVAIRSNFRIGIDAQGKVYGMFDNNDSIESGLDAPRSCQFVDGGPLPLDQWTHVALTFDGSTLAIYVNGTERNKATTSLAPANGVMLIKQNTVSTNAFPATSHTSEPCALIIGARPKKANIYALFPYYLVDGEHKESFDNLQEYFKGYIDELRVWDGARSPSQIFAAYRTSMGFAEAAENREAVFSSWYYDGATRNNNFGAAVLPAELVLNYDFSTLPGAVEPEDVAKTPSGFEKNVLNAAMNDYYSNPDIDTEGLYDVLNLKGGDDGAVEGDLLVGWWSKSEVRSKVYDDYHVVPWIKNTVSHLPPIDGSAPDSFMYGENFGSVYTPASDLGVAKLAFPNTSLPYPSVVWSNDRYYRLAHAALLVERRDTSFMPALYRSRFQVRNNFIGTADLVPLGGAFAKTTTKMWNDNPSDPWEQAGRDGDDDGDGIPNWWEDYARHNYAQIDPSASLGWDTLVDYNGIRMTAGKAYVFDLYRGLQPDGQIRPEYAVNTDTDNGGNGIPDWWERLYGISGQDPYDDADNDGLSNFHEWWLSLGGDDEGFGQANGFPLLDVGNARTFYDEGQRVPDYFLGIHDTGSQWDDIYFGFIATDHDFIENWWEKQYANGYSNASVYDPSDDWDENGWSNYAEARYQMWRGLYNTDQLDGWNVDGTFHVDYFPEPAIAVRSTYYGVQDLTSNASHPQMPTVVTATRTTERAGRIDAKFIAIPSDVNSEDDGNSCNQYIGPYRADSVKRGFLSPGCVIPTTVLFYKSNTGDADHKYWKLVHERAISGPDWWGEGSGPVTNHYSGTLSDYTSFIQQYPQAQLENAPLNWELVASAISDSQGRMATLVHAVSGAKVGMLDLHSGEYSLDMAAVAASDDDPNQLPSAVFMVAYASKIGNEWPQTLYYSNTKELDISVEQTQRGVGRVMEGANMLTSLIDLDGSGDYTPGEPFGVLSGVDVGWHKVPDQVIELKDTSHVVPRFDIMNLADDRTAANGPAGLVTYTGETLDTSAKTAKIAITRTAVNDRPAPKRVVLLKSYVLPDGDANSHARPFIHEGDVLKNGVYDLDWNWLAKDVDRMGVGDLKSATYEISQHVTMPNGSVSNVVLATFVNTFANARSVAYVESPVNGGTVFSAAPTFRWTSSDDTMTAFVLQVFDENDELVYDSKPQLLPGRIDGAYEFTPALYADAPVSVNGAPVFADGANYYWRVAMLNAKYKTANTDDPTVWTDKTPFRMDLTHKGLTTGYGSANAVVRYYGPCGRKAKLSGTGKGFDWQEGEVQDISSDSGLVVVEAFENADFHGRPMAQIRLSSYDDLYSTTDITTANATLRGLDPGTLYFRAYIDQNNNGKRDEWESWGYANHVDTEWLNANGVREYWEEWGNSFHYDGTGKVHSEAVYDPLGVVVTDNPSAQVPTFVIYIEDCDTNRNNVPDSLEDIEGWSDGGSTDSDRDGLSDDDEGEYATDPGIWDTDGDGMPDGWEATFASLDPLFDDAGEASEGDVMAFVLKDATVVTVLNTAETVPVTYILGDGQKAPTVGDSIDGVPLYSVYEYPVVDGNGRVNYYGRGVEVVLEAAPGTKNRVIEVKSGKVALVHAQVYEEFGFDPKTANPAVPEEERVRTKAFTALDKYLVVRYLEALGVEPSDEDKENSTVKWQDCYGLEDWVNVNRMWSEFTLRPNAIDGDWASVGDEDTRYGDGIPDGWELYASYSPWDFADRESDDGDNDLLPLYREFDAGNMPTDPWQADTDGDGVFDVYAWMYHLKGDDAGEDFDGDGLSNYAEYLVSEVFQIVKLDPDDATTNDSTLDYYRKFGELYLGEVFTDHDRVDDDWEADYEFGGGVVYASRGEYDPDKDLDGDGWDNFSEFRAGTSPAAQMSTGIDSYTMIEHPVPVVEMEVVYNGTAAIDGKVLSVKAWNEKTDPDALSAPCATWTVATVKESETAGRQGEATDEVKEKYIGRMPIGKRTYYLGGGAVKEGSFKLLVKDKNWVEGRLVTIGGEINFEATALGEPDDALWFYFVIDQNGKLVARGGIFAESRTVGTIDYDTGRVTIDFDDELFGGEVIVGDPSDAESDSGGTGSKSAGSATYHGLHPADCYVKLTWTPVDEMPVRGVHYLGETDTGYLREGPTTFIVTAEDSEAGNDGEQGGEGTVPPFNRRSMILGVVRNVNVGWAGAKCRVELTDFSPITPRFDPWTGTFDRAEPLVTNDPRINISSNDLESVVASDTLVRVRVVRYAINGYPIFATWGAGLSEVVYDKTFSRDCGRPFCELDFQLDDKFDVDWQNSFVEDVVDMDGATRGSGEYGNLAGTIGDGTSVTNMQYMVVIGDGDVTWERASSGNTVYALPYLITRRFDYTRATAVSMTSDGMQYSARPTFRWSMYGEEETVKRFGSSYTSFRIRVNKGSTVVYDSGTRIAPPADADGNYTWTAPVCAGSMMEEGKMFDTTDSYSWQVSMYNSKFRSDAWSVAPVFSTAVNAAQEVNDHGYSSIGVAVKYAGPSIVLDKCDTMTTRKGKVVVQAFSTPDFSGDPLAQGMATEDVDELEVAEANAWLKGLPAKGTYFVRAFIDMDGNGRLSDWEPWGYAKDEVTLVNDGTMVTAPLVAVWIEDSDSDGDWIPDAYEYAAKGWTVQWSTLKGNKKTQPGGVTAALSDGGIVLTLPVDELTGAGISRGLPGASLTAMQSESFAAALLGLDTSHKTTLEAIAEATRAAIAPDSVKVVSLSITQDGSAAVIAVGADVASGISGTVVGKLYKFDGGDTVNVKVKVWKKNSLGDAAWTLSTETTEAIPLSADTYGTVEVPLTSALDLTGGFFKVELEEVP